MWVCSWEGSFAQGFCGEEGRSFFAGRRELGRFFRGVLSNELMLVKFLLNCVKF